MAREASPALASRPMSTTAAEPPRVAIVVVPGVGDHPAAEAVDQMATALTQLSDDYAWRPDPGRLPVDVPAGGARRAERHDAQRRSLRGPGGMRIDLVEMRWSDLSSFPSASLAAFIASAFGLGVQLATVGLEGTAPGVSRDLRRAWLATWAVILAAAGALILTGIARDGIAPWVVGVAVGLGAALLLAVLAWSRQTLDGFANRMMTITSTWVAAIVIPLTVVAALAGTALWLAVDEPLGIPDPVALGLVAVAGVLAMGYLGRGIGAGGWRLPAEGGFGWASRLLTPMAVAYALLLVAAGICGWRIQATGSIEAGLGQTVLVVGGYAIRPAWLGALLLVATTLVLLLVVLWRGGPAALRATFTRGATTLLSPLLVALVGTVLVGGIGAFAFQSADDATWGADAGELRCLADPSDWSWSQECGAAGAGWEDAAAAIEDLEARAAAAETRAAGAREGFVRRGEGSSRAGIAPAAEAAFLRDEIGALERGAGANPTAWATEMFGIAMLPLLPVLLVVVIAGIFCINLLMARRAAGEMPGGRLSDALALFTGRIALTALVAGGVAAALVGIGIWVLGWADDPAGSAQSWAWLSVVAIAITLLGRVVPIDPREWRGQVGGGLTTARTALDIPYDVATYLRIDTDDDGIRSRIVARYRALLAAIEHDYDHIVVAAHSQGSMYSLATLAGDRDRGWPDHPGLPGDAPWGVAPWHVVNPGSPLVARGVSLLTFGCPVRQTYEERLPGQYAWTDAGAPGLGERLAMVSGAWVNAYRPRDYIGRAVFHPPGAPWTTTQGVLLAHDLMVPGRAAPVPIVDACIPGGGSHTGYFGDLHLAAWLDAVVRRAVSPAADWYPPGYAPGGPPDAA